MVFTCSFITIYYCFIHCHLLHCHLLPFTMKFLNGNKWIFITIYYLGQHVDVEGFTRFVTRIQSNVLSKNQRQCLSGSKRMAGLASTNTMCFRVNGSCCSQQPTYSDRTSIQIPIEEHFGVSCLTSIFHLSNPKMKIQHLKSQFKSAVLKIHTPLVIFFE